MNWQEKINLVNSQGESYHPSVGINSDTLHLVWFDNRDGNYEIYYKNSFDGGITWSSDIRLTQDTSLSIYPTITVNQNIINIFYNDNRNGKYEIFTRRSQDNGLSWEDEINLQEGYFPKAFVSGEFIHLVYRKGDDIFYKYSIDNGTNWSEEFRVSNNEGVSEYPSILAKKDTVYIIWFDERDGNPEIYFKKNEGDTTETGIEEISFNDNVLFQNVPNPFREKTIIKFFLFKEASCELRIYNVSGQLVKSFNLGNKKKGLHRIFWDGKDSRGERCASGIYFIQLKIEDTTKTKKLLFLP